MKKVKTCFWKRTYKESKQPLTQMLLYFVTNVPRAQRYKQFAQKHHTIKLPTNKIQRYNTYSSRTWDNIQKPVLATKLISCMNGAKVANKTKTEEFAQTDVCLASHQEDTCLSLTGIKGDLCPHPSQASHPKLWNLSATLMLEDAGNVSEEKTAIKRRNYNKLYDYPHRDHENKQHRNGLSYCVFLFHSLP